METIDIIKDLCRTNKITIKGLEEALNESPSSIAKATSNMKAEKLYKIAAYFHVSMESIMGKDDIVREKVTKSFPLSKGYDITPFEYELVLAFRQADDVDHATIVRALGLEEKEKEAASRA